MNAIKSKLSSLGGFVAGAGAISIILKVISILEIANFEIRILMWIDLWGPVAGWMIRIGLAVVGIAQFLIFSQSDEETE